MAFRFAVLAALVLAVPAGRPTPGCTAIPNAPTQSHEQARLLLAEWRKAIRTAETPDDWAAVDAIAREVSRLAAPRQRARVRLAATGAEPRLSRRCRTASN
jgi:hypothetical protein